jgi:hypothetical protein
MNQPRNCLSGTIRLLVVLGFVLPLFLPWQAVAEQGDRISPACRQPLSEEHYLYDLDFLFFDNLAEGELRLSATEQPNVLRAELIGRTRGVAAWLTGDRTQRYFSFMERQPDGFLRSLTHESQIFKRRSGHWKTSRKRYRFDYGERKVFQEKAKEGAFCPSKVFDLPDGQYPVDILTGFYNLRSGCYGEIVPGMHLEIPTFSSKGLSTIDIEVLTSEQRHNSSGFPAGGTLLKVTLDPEVFETTDGGMYLWFDESGQPANGIVENVIGLGNVIGNLREETGP